MSIFAIAGCALLAAVLVLLVRELQAPMAAPVRIVAALVLFFAAFSLFLPVLSCMTELFSLSGGTDTARILLRALGVALVAEITASLCRDLGEGTLANGVALFGKLEILLLALPFVDELLAIAKELLEW